MCQLGLRVGLGLDDTFRAYNRQIKRVILFEESGTQHVEDGQLAVLVLVQIEVRTHIQAVQLAAEVDTRHDAIVVQFQSLAVVHQIEVHVTVLGHVVALEVRAAQLQGCRGLGRVLGRDVLRLALQRIGESGLLAAGVELEHHQIVVVPVEDFVLDAQRVARVAAYAVHLDDE